MKRIILIVLDSAGVGALPDAASYGDAGANTLGHIAEAVGLKLPNLTALGLGNILPLRGVASVQQALGVWGKAASLSKGKDTTIGHWEIAGLVMREALPTWPRGFPPELLGPFELAIGRKVLGNKAASGTEIIDELGSEHVQTGRPIVYTSADSVFQIAAHENVVPLETLYGWCRIARQLVPAGRVIARPFVGRPGVWQRTANRHDYSLEPPGTTVLDVLAKAGVPVTGIGKISDIFAGRGLSQSHPVAGNHEGMMKTISLARGPGTGLIFTNLVDFDMKFGHRRDAAGYGQALEAFDAQVPELRSALREGDLVIITADHGCDPTWQGSDHTREYIPILAFGPGVQGGTIGTRQSFADLGATIAELLVGPEAAREFPAAASFAKEFA